MNLYFQLLFYGLMMDEMFLFIEYFKWFINNF